MKVEGSVGGGLTGWAVDVGDGPVPGGGWGLLLPLPASSVSWTPACGEERGPLKGPVPSLMGPQAELFLCEP